MAQEGGPQEVLREKKRSAWEERVRFRGGDAGGRADQARKKGRCDGLRTLRAFCMRSRPSRLTLAESLLRALVGVLVTRTKMERAPAGMASAREEQLAQNMAAAAATAATTEETGPQSGATPTCAL